MKVTPNELRPLIPYLKVFETMLIAEGSEIREECETNKSFHLGRKEYFYRQTLSGHRPVLVENVMEQ